MMYSNSEISSSTTNRVMKLLTIGKNIILGVPPEQLTRKTYHVVYNPMLALAIYLVLHGGMVVSAFRFASSSSETAIKISLVSWSTVTISPVRK